MQRKSTLWDRRRRLNVESDLLFNGISQSIQSNMDTRFNFGINSFSFSFFFEWIPDAASGVLFSLTVSGNDRIIMSIGGAADPTSLNFNIQKPTGTDSVSVSSIINANKKNHIVGQKTSTDIELYLNRVLIGSTPIVNILGQVFNFNGFLLRLMEQFSNNYAKGNLSNFSVFNKNLSKEEINYIHTNGGILPESVHLSCVAHYPLTQRDYFKADAAFVAKHPQFIVGDLVAFDEVEQFNYSKDIQQNFGNPPTYDGDLNFSGDGGLQPSSYLINWPASTVIERKITRDYQGSRVLSLTLGVLVISANVNARIDVVRNSDSFVLFTSPLSLGNNIIDLSSISSTENDYSIEIVGDHFVNDGNNANFQFRKYDTRFILLPTHGKLVNFTDAEVGAGASRSLATSIRDFYLKEQLNKLGYSNKFTGITITGTADYQFYRYDKGSPIFSTAADWTCLVTAIMPGAFNFTGAGNVLSGTGRFALSVGSLSFRTPLIARFILGGSIFDLPFGKAQNPEQAKAPFVLMVSHDVSANTIKLLYSVIGSDVIVTETFDTTLFPIANSYNDIRLQSVVTHGNAIVTNLLLADSYIDTPALEKEISELNFSNINNKYLHWKFDKTSNSLLVEDVSGNGRDGVLSVNDITPTPILIEPPNAIIETDSALPELKESFNIDNTFSITTPVSVGNDVGTGDVTTLVTIKIPQELILQGGSRFIAWFTPQLSPGSFYVLTDGRVRIANSQVFDLYKAGEAETNIITVIYKSNLSALTSDANIDFVNNRIFNAGNIANSDITGLPLKISGIDQGLELFRFGVWKRLLSEKEMLDLSNNTILKNPTIAQQKDLICYYNSNQSSFYEDGSNVLLTDYSGNGYDAVVLGLTGATSSDKLADVPNHISEINSLR